MRLLHPHSGYSITGVGFYEALTESEALHHTLSALSHCFFIRTFSREAGFCSHSVQRGSSHSSEVPMASMKPRAGFEPGLLDFEAHALN